MKAFIVYDEGIPTVTVRDGNKTVKTYVYKRDQTKYLKDVLDPLSWYESDYPVKVPRSNKGVFVVDAGLWWAMNVYLNHLKDPNN